jgi:hypothetical protein
MIPNDTGRMSDAFVRGYMEGARDQARVDGMPELEDVRATAEGAAFAAGLDATPAPEPVGQRGAVAWQYRAYDADEGWGGWIACSADAARVAKLANCETRALYAHPPQPVAGDAVERAAKAMMQLYFGPQAWDTHDNQRTSYINLARAAVSAAGAQPGHGKDAEREEWVPPFQSSLSRDFTGL